MIKLFLDKFSVFTRGLAFGVAGALQRVVFVIMMPIYSIFIDANELGIVGLLSVLPVVLVPVFSLGLSTSISVCYFSVKDANTRAHFISNAQWLTTVSCLIMLTLGFVFSQSLSMWLVGSGDYPLDVMIVLLTVAATILSLPGQFEYQFTSAVRPYAVTMILGAIAALGSGFLFVVVVKLGSTGVLLAMFSGVAVTYISILYLRQRDSTKKCVPLSWFYAKQLLRHGLVILPSFILLFFVSSWVRWPVEETLGLSAVASYTVGATFAGTLSFITAGIVAAWTPWAMNFSSEWNDKGKYVVGHRLMLYAVSGAFVVFCYTLLSRPVIAFVFPKEYLVAWKVVGILTAANFLLSLFSMLLPPLYMAKRVQLVLLPQLAAAIIVVTTVQMFLSLELVGAALAVLLGSLVLVFGQIVVNQNLKTIALMQIHAGCLCVGALGFSALCLLAYSVHTTLGDFYVLRLIALFSIGCIFYRFIVKKVEAFDARRPHVRQQKNV